MIKFIFIFISIFIFQDLLSKEIKIELMIGNEIITSYDIEKEVRYLEIINPNLLELDNVSKTMVAKNQLISETIKKKEILKFSNLDNKNELTEDYLKNLYFSLGLNEFEFKKKLINNKSYSIDEIEEKLKIELAWNEIIYAKYKDQVIIDKEDIIKKINSIKNKTIKYYDLSEIVFVKKKNESIENLFDQIKLSIDEIGFKNTANIYSNSESAKFGGSLGWVSELSMSNDIKTRLNNLNKGDVTDFIKIGNNFLILKVDDIKFENTEINEKIEIDKLVNIEQNRQLNRFSKLHFNKTKLNFSINEK